MALLSKKEFAEECGMNTRKLAVYIGRGRVVVIEESGLIDDTNVVNIEFRKIYADKKQAPATARGKRSKTKTGSPAADKAEKAAGDLKNQQSAELYELNKRAKAVQIAREERESFILQARIQKMNGELIPTDLVKQLFATHFREVTLGFKQALDFLLLEIGSSHKMNDNQIKVWRMKMIALLNEAVNKSTDNSKKAVANVVAEYQQMKKTA